MNENLHGIVYMFTNLINNKKYIGITTKTLEERCQHHLWNRNDGGYFHHALKKYGMENFKLETIDKANSIVELKEKEIFWIKFYNSCKQGYNLTRGGDGCWGYKHTEETKEFLRKINSGKNNHMYGKVMSEETIGKISKSLQGENNHNYGKPMNEQTKYKLSKTQQESKRYVGKNNPNYGKTHSKNTRYKMSENHANFIGGNHPQAIEIVQLTIDNVMINIYPSSKEAFENTGADRSHIIKCCKNKSKTAKGFKWMYKKDYEGIIKSDDVIDIEEGESIEPNNEKAS